MKSHRFFDFFPPPVFLKMLAVGLSAESDALRLVSFDKRRGQPVLKIAEEFNLESGTIVNGEIAKPEKLAAVLKNIRNKHDARFVRMALPEEKAYVYETIIPVPDDGEIGDAVEFSLEQNIPLSAAEAVFDFKLIEEPFSKDGILSARVAVSAYPAGIIKRWVDVLKQADITPLALVSESQALARALIARGDNRTALLVHFLKDKTVVLVAAGGFARFSTTVGGGLENAEKILESHADEKIAESVELLSVRDEVKKVYSYWMSKEGVKSQKEPKGIKSVIVAGQVADMADVTDYLGKHLAAPVSFGNVWQNAFSLDDYIPKINFEDSLRFAVAAGVALPN